MSALEKFYPKSENLSKECQYWCLGGLATGCCFPKVEISGRRSCEGIIDDVCLFVIRGRKLLSLSVEKQQAIKSIDPSTPDKSYLPPGGVI